MGRITLFQSNWTSSNQPSLGTRDCDSELSHPTYHYSRSKVMTSYTLLTNQKVGILGGRNSDSCPEAGSTRSPSHNKGVLFKHVHGAKEGWGSEICYQSEISKQICESAFQDKRPTHSQGSPTEEQLDCQSRPQRCLLHDSSFTSTSPPFPLQPRNEDNPIQLPPLWTMHSPRVFTKILKPAIEKLKTMDICLVVYMDNILIMALL